MKTTVLGLQPSEYNPNNYGGFCSRAVKFEQDADLSKGISTVATTSNPALVFDWNSFRMIREVLPMDSVEIPNPNKVPLLDSHSRMSVANIKGSAKNFRVEGNALISDTFISESETEIMTKIKEKHIDSVSIGYETSNTKTLEVPTGKAVTVNGVAYTNDFKDGVPFVIRTWWRVKELSLVPIGADDQAKFRAAAAMNVESIVEQVNSLKTEIEELKQKHQPTQTETTTKPETVTDKKAEVKTEQKQTQETVLKIKKEDYEKFKELKRLETVRTAIQKAIKYHKGIVS